jgi:hypothetical protein
MIHQGSCHCGAVAFEVEGEVDKVIECNCTHCSRKGYLLWFLPREALRMKTPEDLLSTYTFNKHVIQHRFCPSCGCAPLAFGEQGGKPMIAVNVRCLEDVDLSEITRVSYDGLSK